MIPRDYITEWQDQALYLTVLFVNFRMDRLVGQFPLEPRLFQVEFPVTPV
jgi:hypothetical protein